MFFPWPFLWDKWILHHDIFVDLEACFTVVVEFCQNIVKRGATVCDRTKDCLIARL